MTGRPLVGSESPSQPYGWLGVPYSGVAVYLGTWGLLAGQAGKAAVFQRLF